MIYCSICYSTNLDGDLICDTCDDIYCEDCSYTYTLHYQFEGCRCYVCADQSRLHNIYKKEIRNNKLKVILNEVDK